MPRRSRYLVSNLVRMYPGVQLATLTEAAPEGPEWLHEVKFDGYRLLGFVASGEVLLRTRNGKDWTEKFPSIADALRVLRVADAVVDMEAVVLDPTGKSSFRALQAALSEGGDRRRVLAFAFDLLHLAGECCTGLPLLERKRKLQTLLRTAGAAIRYSDHFAGAGGALLGEACGHGLEGIVSKRSGDGYVIGRQRSWLKAKCEKRQEFLILGYSAARSGPRALGALYLGYRKGETLHYAGKCGTGFSLESARVLRERLRPVEAPVIERSEAAELPAAEWREVRWVEPSTVCEVSFAEWPAGGRIRHSVFQGLREDKKARAVRKEEPWRRRSRSASRIQNG